MDYYSNYSNYKKKYIDINLCNNQYGRGDPPTLSDDPPTPSDDPPTLSDEPPTPSDGSKSNQQNSIEITSKIILNIDNLLNTIIIRSRESVYNIIEKKGGYDEPELEPKNLINKEVDPYTWNFIIDSIKEIKKIIDNIDINKLTFDDIVKLLVKIEKSRCISKFNYANLNSVIKFYCKTEKQQGQCDSIWPHLPEITSKLLKQRLETFNIIKELCSTIIKNMISLVPPLKRNKLKEKWYDKLLDNINIELKDNTEKLSKENIIHPGRFAEPDQTLQRINDRGILHSNIITTETFSTTRLDFITYISIVLNFIYDYKSIEMLKKLDLRAYKAYGPIKTFIEETKKEKWYREKMISL